MGFNTTVLVLNDAVDEIENDPTFNKRLADAIRQHGKDPKSISAGCHANAATVVNTHHADVTSVVAVGGNYATVLDHIFLDKHHEKEDLVILLKSLAQKCGYTIAKKRKRKRQCLISPLKSK